MSLEDNANLGRNGFDPDVLFWVNLRWLLYKALRNVHTVPTPIFFPINLLENLFSPHLQTSKKTPRHLFSRPNEVNFTCLKCSNGQQLPLEKGGACLSQGETRQSHYTHTVPCLPDAAEQHVHSVDAKYCSMGYCMQSAAVSPWPHFLHGSGPSSYIWVFTGLARAASAQAIQLRRQTRIWGEVKYNAGRGHQ